MRLSLLVFSSIFGANLQFVWFSDLFFSIGIITRRKKNKYFVQWNRNLLIKLQRKSNMHAFWPVFHASLTEPHSFWLLLLFRSTASTIKSSLCAVSIVKIFSVLFFFLVLHLLFLGYYFIHFSISPFVMTHDVKSK